jgi:mutual gliding-motility protein MglA
MAHLNVKERVIEAKIVYFGAGLSGKTTNLEQVKRLSDGGKCGELVSLDTDGDRTLFFDWLPFDIGKVNGCDVKLQLYTVPGQPQYAETRRKVLAGSDGVVLVLDSQTGALDKNREVMKDLRESMVANGLSMESMAFVLQLNKRDLPTAMTPSELLDAVGMPDAPYFEAVASSGKGVFETLREATRQVLAHVRDAARDRRSDLRVGDVAGLDGHRLYTTLTGEAALPMASLPTVVPKAQPSTSASNGATAPTQMANASPSPVRDLPRAPKTELEPAVGARDVPRESPVAAKPRDVNGQATPSQLGEVIASNRALSRRLDQMERTLEQAISQAARGLETSLVDKTRERIGEMNEGLRASLASDVEGLGRQQEGINSQFQSFKVQLGALHGVVDQRLETHERSGEYRSAMLNELGEKVELVEARLEAVTARLASLDGIATRLTVLDEVSAKVTALGRLEAKVVELSTLAQKLGAVAAATDAKLVGIDAKLVSVAEVASYAADTRTRIDSVDRKVAAIATLDKRLEGLEKDRVTPHTIDSRLAGLVKILGDNFDAMVERHLSRDREEAKRDRSVQVDGLRGLGKMISESSTALGTRVDALVDGVAQTESRLVNLESRMDTEALRSKQTEARIEALAGPIGKVQEGVSAIDARMAERFSGATKAFDHAWAHSNGQFKYVGEKVTEIGIIIRKMNEEMAQKKGWFR